MEPLQMVQTKRKSHGLIYRMPLFGLFIISFFMLAAFSDIAAAAVVKQLKMPLSQAAPVGVVELKGMRPQFEVSLPIPQRWRIREAKLSFSYVNSSALDPKKSRIVVRLNNKPQAQITLQPQSPVGEVSVKLPPEQLKAGYNTLTFMAALHLPDEKCEDVTAPELWTTLELDKAQLEFTYELLPVPLQLSSMTDFLFDPRIIGEFGVNIIVPDLSADSLKAAALTASGVAIRMKYRPVHLTLSHKPVPDIDNILLGDKAFVDMILGEQAPAIDSAMLAVQQGVGEAGQKKEGEAVTERLVQQPEYAMIVLTGADMQDVLKSATFFATLNKPGSDENSLKVSKITPPAIREYFGKALFEPGNSYRFKEMGFNSHTFEGFNPDPKSLNFRLPSDVYIKPNKNLVLSLDLSYGSGLRQDSSIKILLNNQFVFSIPLNNSEGAHYQGYRIHLPTYLIHEGYNTLEFVPVLTPLVYDPCKYLQQENLRLTIFDNSTLEIPEMEHWTALPDLKLFVLDGFPFARWPDLRETAVFLPEKNLKNSGAALNVIAMLSQKSGIPPLELTFTEDWQKESQKNIIVIGQVSSLPPQIIEKSSLGGSTPYVLEGIFRKLPSSQKSLVPKIGSKDEDIHPEENKGLPADQTTWTEHGTVSFAEKLILNEFQSVLSGQTTMFLLTAADSSTLLQGSFVLWEPAVQANFQDDLAVVELDGPESKVWSQKTKKPYFIGEIRGESHLNRFVFANPWIAMTLLIVLLAVLGGALVYFLRRYLSQRTGEEENEQ